MLGSVGALPQDLRSRPFANSRPRAFDHTRKQASGMSHQFYDVVGLIGSFVISASLVPQIYKVYTTKSARDISRNFQWLYVIGLILVVIYGFGEGLWPIYIPCTLEMLGGMALLIMKYYYDGKDDQDAGLKSGAHLEARSAVSPRVNKYSFVLTPK